MEISHVLQNKVKEPECLLTLWHSNSGLLTSRLPLGENIPLHGETTVVTAKNLFLSDSGTNSKQHKMNTNVLSTGVTFMFQRYSL